MPHIRAKCMGPNTVSATVDEETREYLDRVARRNGVSVAEVLRRLIDFYRAFPEHVGNEVDL